VGWIDDTYETPVRVHSIFIQHYLFDKLPQQQFTARWENEWDICNPTVSAVNGGFVVLAANARAPQVIERGNAIAVEFHLQTRYPETQRLLVNYLQKIYERMQGAGSLSSSANILRNEIGVLMANVKLAYSATQFGNRGKTPSLQPQPKITIARGTAEPIHLPRTAPSASSSLSATAQSPLDGTMSPTAAGGTMRAATAFTSSPLVHLSLSLSYSLPLSQLFPKLLVVF
jgi:hypothetical protein